MATLHCRGEADTVPVVDGDAVPATRPAAPVAPTPEAIPLPKAQPAKEPTVPDLVEPSRSSPPPKEGIKKDKPAAVPRSKAQPGKDPTVPDLLEPPPSRPLPGRGMEKGQSPDVPQDPPQDKGPVPIKKTDYEQSGGGLRWY